MDAYITCMFWINLVSVIGRSLLLVGEHPRKQIISVGGDAFALIANTALLAWVSWVKYGQ
jgi:hypothetical protein